MQKRWVTGAILLAVLIIALAGCGQSATPKAAYSNEPTALDEPQKYVGKKVTVDGILELDAMSGQPIYYLQGGQGGKVQATPWAPVDVIPPAGNGPAPKSMADYLGKHMRVTGKMTKVGDIFVIEVEKAEEIYY